MPSIPGESRFLIRHPLDVIAQAHAVQEQTCDAMERIADNLPHDDELTACHALNCAFSAP